MTPARSLLAPGLLVLAGCSGATPARVGSPPPKPPLTTDVAPSLRGHVLDEAGRALARAHVAIVGADGKTLEPHEVAGDGSFTIALPTSKRLVPVRVVGTEHRTETLLVATEDGAVDVTVNLGTLAARREVEPVLALLLEGPGAGAAPRAMTRAADGTFSLEIDAPEGRHAYGIYGVVANHAVAGAKPESFALTKDHEYVPQVTTTGGKARVAFDPRAWPAARASTVAFGGAAATSAALTEIHRRVAESNAAAEELFDTILKAKGGPPRDAGERITAGRKAEWIRLKADLAPRTRSPQGAIVRQAASVAYFHEEAPASPSEDEQALARRILVEVAPDDVLWGQYRSFAATLKVAAPVPTPESRTYRDAFVARQPSTPAVAAFLASELRSSKDPATRRQLVAELRKDRFAGSMEQASASAYDPDRRLAPGKTLAFEVKSLAGAAALTPKDLAGKVYLVDVWGTWCAPCVAEMSSLHELYAKYGGARTGRSKRFEIVSIALEEKADRVNAFRKDKAHPMPWLHGIASPDTFLESFGGPGVGVPFHVLVDEKGRILASSPELGNSELPELVERALR